MFPPCLVSALQRSTTLLALLGLALLAGCAGGGNNPPPTPPSAVAPTIATQPASLTVTAPQPAAFSVLASGTAPLQYQWKKDGAILGTNAAALSLATTATTDAGSYTVTVSNAGGSVTSQAALLTVNPAQSAPVFTLQPVDLTLTEGQNGQFAVAVSGLPTPVLEWQVSVNNGAWSGFGLTTLVYDVLGATVADSGRRYRVVASSSAGTATSNTATLTVNAVTSAPVFTTQPANLTLIEGQTAQFAVVASGMPAPVLQWQSSQDGGANWGSLSGETGTSFTVPNVPLAYTGRQFRAVATNSAGAITSNAALLTVNAAPGAKAFGTALLIETGATSAARPQIASAPNGDAVAVWMQQSDGLYFHIWANRYSAAAHSWGTAELINSGVGDAWDPQIAMDPNGNALVVWQQDGDATASLRYDLVANHYTAGTGWGVATLIETDDAGSAMSPQVAMDTQGNGLAVWLQGDGASASHIRSNRFSAGTGTWGTATLIEAATQGASATPQVSFDPSGNAMAVWSRYDGINNLALANRYLAGTGWSTAVIIGSDTAFVAIGQTQLASDGNGNALAVWVQGGKIQANRYTNGTGWGTAALIEWNGGDANFPQVAFDTTGNALVVWQMDSGFGTPRRIWSNRYTAGSGWGGFPAMIQTDSSGGATANAEAPQIAFDPAGNALAVWVQPDGASDNTPDIWVNRYTAGSGWGTTANLGQVRINTPGTTGQPAGQPQITCDASGNALVVWYQSDGTADSIWSNRFQ